MRYCSRDARKVIELLEGYTLVVKDSEFYDVEAVVAKFWVTQVDSTIKTVLRATTKTTTAEKVERAREAGWPYFAKAIWSMLTPRPAAFRIDEFDIPLEDEWARKLYNLVSTSVVLADYNMKELAILTLDLPLLISDAQALARYADAARRGGSRNIYYLHGIAKREYETQQGKIKELQEQRESGATGWTPDESIEEIDIVERKMLEKRWKDRLNDISISSALNNVQTPRPR